MKRYLRAMHSVSRAMVQHPGVFVQTVKTAPSVCDASAFSQAVHASVAGPADQNAAAANPLWTYFQNHREGPGIWKWEHYFDIYQRHLAKFVGRKVDVLEIGIYSGGSLEMWRSYFGEQCHIYGVDIEEVCRTYENDHVSVFIGDQADRNFWSTFKDEVPGVDVLIDDGGHTPEQQQVTLEEMLQHIRPGGVYLCEDVHGTFNRFSAFAAGLVNDLNSMNRIEGATLECNATPFQSAIHSIHFYPYVVVIEKHLDTPHKLSAPRHGTQWQPSFKR